MGRIVKQFDDALDALNASKRVNFGELPTPPGYPPIPEASELHTQPFPVQESAAKPKKTVAMAIGQSVGSSGPAEVSAMHVFGVYMYLGRT